MNENLPELFDELARNTPKTNLVVFAGRVGGRLLDNVKYFFRHCLATDQPFQSLFLTHHEEEQRLLAEAGLPTLFFPSREALKILPRARALVADDFWFKTQTVAYHLLSRAATLQIWHGIPLKLIGFPEIESDLNMTPEKAEHLRFGYSDYDAAVSTSPFVTETSLGRVFKCDQMWETGYPRNDVLFREPDEVDLMGVDTEALKRIKAYKEGAFRTVFFMPTFRDTGGDPFSDKALDLGELEAFGRKNKILFILKFHPYVTIRDQPDTKAVLLVRSDSDAYPLLRQADCLVTDYSSVAYDFLLTDRPQIFFPYDLEKYLSRDRGMFYPYEEMAPGPRPTDQEGLFQALLDVLGGKDDHARDREALRGRLFADPDGRACERIAQRFAAAFFS